MANYEITLVSSDFKPFAFVGRETYKHFHLTDTKTLP